MSAAGATMGIREALSTYDTGLDLDADYRPCEGSKFHSPTPLLTHETDLVLDVANRFDTVPDLVVLCSVCRENLDVFVRLMTASSGTLPWEIKRQFGNRIRSLGMTVWDKYLKENRG